MSHEHSVVAVETLIANRYRILRTIGAGGMATVYEALDTTIGQLVAVKLLNPALAGSIAIDRFLREIAITRRLRHPQVIPILDSGTHEESPYFVMALVPGESLRERLRREKQLSVADALRIVRDLLAALGAAHHHNIVHRDVKPANILLSGGRAIVADFGIARAYSEAAVDRVTASGIVVGTAGYMSPEQASGEARLDGRTDLYAVGCVLYEMLAGEPPFTGPTSQSIVAKQMSLPAPSLAVVRSATPPALDRLLQRALAKAPADRIATAAEFIAGLDAIERGADEQETRHSVRRHELLVSVAAIAVVFAGSTVAKEHLLGSSVPTTLGDTTRYAVLPPARVDVAPNVLPDLSDLLREALGRWSGITVTDSTAPRAGRSVAATLSPAGDSLRLRVQLRESNGSLLADHTERLSPNDSATASRLATAVDRLLFRGMAPPDERVTAPARSLASRQAFMLGIAAVERWRLPVAESLFQTAVDQDNGYARAHLWLALTRAWRDVEPARWQSAARQAQAGAQALTAHEARLAEIVAAQSDADFPRACAGWRSLTRADSNDALAWFGSGHCQRQDAAVLRDRASPSGFRFRSSYHRALQDFRRAFQLRPAILASLSDAEIRGLFRTAGNRRRQGWTAAPDSQFFAANAEWRGDSLAYVPYARTAARGVEPLAGKAEAVRQLRVQVRDIASSWVTAAPTDPAAWETLALSLAELGDNSALDTIAVADRFAKHPADRLRVAVSTAWLQLAAALALGDPHRAESISRLVDSLLRTSAPSVGDPSLLTALAALTGRGHIAATYARLPQMDRALGMPAALRESGSPLLIYAALGGPADSIAVLERRANAAIDATVRPAGRANERLAILARAATMAYPAERMSSLATLVGQGDGLLDLQAALDRGDSAFVRDSLHRLRAARSKLAPETITLDAIAPELRLFVALGDFFAAESWVDPTLASFGQLVPRLRTRPIEAASLVPILVQRSQIAARLGKRAEAQRWAQFARVLWAGADPYLRPLLDSLPS